MLARFKGIANQPLLVALIAGDLMYILLHILHLLPSDIFPLFQGDAFLIYRDAGVAESFQYLKELWIVLIFAWLVFRQRRTPLLGLLILFSYFLLDDIAQIHERIGDLFAGLFTNLPLYNTFTRLQPDDFGELIAAGILGLVFVGVIALFYLRAGPPTRRIFHTVLALLGVLLFFAIGIDFIGEFAVSRVVREGFMLAEDGGEMLVMSLICWYTTTLVGKFQYADSTIRSE